MAIPSFWQPKEFRFTPVIGRDTHFLVVCQRGNVRSVTVATILKDYAGFKDAIAIGVETTSQLTLDEFEPWADYILIAGDVDTGDTWLKKYQKSCQLLEIGKDKWGQAMHPELVRLSIAALRSYGFITDISPNFGTLDNYLQAVDAKFKSLAS